LPLLHDALALHYERPRITFISGIIFTHREKKSRQQKMGDTPSKCTLCGNDMTFKYRPMEKWNISGMLCSQCYEKKLIEHYIAPDRRDVTKR
jgi:hypothetical protein